MKWEPLTRRKNIRLEQAISSRRFVGILAFLMCFSRSVSAFQPPRVWRSTRSRTTRCVKLNVHDLESRQEEKIVGRTRVEVEKESSLDDRIYSENTILPAQSIGTTMPSPGNASDEQSSKRNTELIIMIILCWGVACLSALDRVAMSVAILPMSQEFGYTETVKGQISALFSIGYGCAVLPSGLLVSSKASSPRLVLGCGILLWSLATLATPLVAATGLRSDVIAIAFTISPLLTARAVVGAAEAVVLPSLQRLMSSWIDSGQKSLAVAGIFSGFQAGTVVAYLLSPFVIDQMGGWRGLFYFYGCIGLLWLVPWLILAKDSPGTPSAEQKGGSSASNLVAFGAEEEFSALESASSPPLQEAAARLLKSAPWKELLSSKSFWAMTIAHAANNWGLYNNLSWTPTFYAETYGLDVKESAWFSILPSVTGAVGGLLAGALADTVITRIEHREESEGRESYNGSVRTKTRRIFQGIALYGPAAMLALLSAHLPEEPWAAQTILMGMVGLQAFNAAGYGAANQEKAGEKWSGLLYSLSSLPGVAVGSFGVFVTGQVLDATHDWTIVYAINAFVNVVGATAFVTLYDSKKEWD